MKLPLIAAIGAGLAFGATGFAADDAAVINSPKGKMSYAVGMALGRNVTNTLVEVDVEAAAAGLKAVLSGGKPLLTEQQVTEAMNEFQGKMMAKRGEAQKMMQEK